MFSLVIELTLNTSDNHLVHNKATTMIFERIGMIFEIIGKNEKDKNES